LFPVSKDFSDKNMSENKVKDCNY